MARPTLGNSVLSDLDDDPVVEDYMVSKNPRNEGSFIHNWVSTDYGTPVCKKCHLYIDDDFIVKFGGQDGTCYEFDMNPVIHPNREKSNLKGKVGF